MAALNTNSIQRRPNLQKIFKLLRCCKSKNQVFQNFGLRFKDHARYFNFLFYFVSPFGYQRLVKSFIVIPSVVFPDAIELLKKSDAINR